MEEVLDPVIPPSLRHKSSLVQAPIPIITSVASPNRTTPTVYHMAEVARGIERIDEV